MRISDWSSDVCSSDLGQQRFIIERGYRDRGGLQRLAGTACRDDDILKATGIDGPSTVVGPGRGGRSRRNARRGRRSEEHTSELQSLMRISYAVFCLKNKKKNKQ